MNDLAQIIPLPALLLFTSSFMASLGTWGLSSFERNFTEKLNKNIEAEATGGIINDGLDVINYNNKLAIKISQAMYGLAFILLALMILDFIYIIINIGNKFFNFDLSPVGIFAFIILLLFVIIGICMKLFIVAYYYGHRKIRPRFPSLNNNKSANNTYDEGCSLS